MKFSICSFSFHRLMGAGQQDIFQYVRTCRELGCTHLQPWCAHFSRGVTLQQIQQVGYNPGDPDAPAWLDAPKDKGYLGEVRAAAKETGLAFELIAVDRAAVYQPTAQARAQARDRALRWIEAAAELGAEGIRVDSGGPEAIDSQQLAQIREGYAELIRAGRGQGVSVYVENHWGACCVPENILTFLREIDGLKYLFDTNNWSKGTRDDGWRKCGPLAQATHFKAFSFNAAGEEPSVDLPSAVRMLVGAGYSGVWGVESMPRDGDEIGAARKTMELIRRSAAPTGK